MTSTELTAPVPAVDEDPVLELVGVRAAYGAIEVLKGVDLRVPAGSVVALLAVNATLDEVMRPINLSAFGEKGQELSVWTLADRDRAGKPDLTNSFADPERIALVESKFKAAGPEFNYRFPALSLTLLLWRVD